MPYRPCAFALLVLVALAGCDQIPDERSEQAQEDVAMIDERAVWRDSGVFELCRSEDEALSLDGCMVDVLHRAKAPDEVIEAVETLSAEGDAGFVSGFRREGLIGVAQVTYPFRPNTNQGTLLVASDGTTIDVDRAILSEEDQHRADYSAFLAAHPGVMPFPPASLTRSERLNGGGEQLRFDTALRGCHACEIDGWLSVAYDFDAAGRFLGHQLVEVKWSENAAATPSVDVSR